MENEKLILHIPSGDIVKITKVNTKTFTGKSIIQHPNSKQVRVNKSDCVPYEGTIESVKLVKLEESGERDPQAVNKKIAERLSYFNKL